MHSRILLYCPRLEYPVRAPTLVCHNASVFGLAVFGALSPIQRLSTIFYLVFAVGLREQTRGYLGYLKLQHSCSTC